MTGFYTDSRPLVEHARERIRNGVENLADGAQGFLAHLGALDAAFFIIDDKYDVGPFNFIKRIVNCNGYKIPQLISC